MTSTQTPPAPFVVSDTGPGFGATGAATTDESGRPVTYTVAEDDKLGTIADRFGVGVNELTKPDGSRYAFSDEGIHPGDVMGFKQWSPECRSFANGC